MTLQELPESILEELLSSECPQSVLMELLGSLNHPYIYPVLDLDFFHTPIHHYVCLVMPFNNRGSLKDLIYKVSNSFCFITKYINHIAYYNCVFLNYDKLVVKFLKSTSFFFFLQSQWNEPFKRKYAKRTSGLPMSQIQRLGRQILEALLFLRDRGIPTHGHLHSGNVMIQNGVAR